MTTPASVPTLVVTTDKASYNVGDTLTVNVAYADAQSQASPLTITVTGTDAAGGTATATAQVLVTTQGPSQNVDVEATDSFGDTYTVVSNDGSSAAVLSTTVGTPPAAPAA
jgi:carbon monoxide dehydrogenase subunit G